MQKQVSKLVYQKLFSAYSMAPELQFLKEPSSIFAFGFFILLLKFIIFKHKSSKRKIKLPPGPPKLPLIGNLHQLGNQPHVSCTRLAQKYGHIIHLQLGEIPTLVVSSARLAKEVLKTHDLALASRPQIFSAKHLFYNCTDITFSPYGPHWRNVRKICILELLSAKRVQSFSHIREEEVARLVSRVAESYPGTTNLTKHLALYASDHLCRVAFGKRFSEGGEYDRYGFHHMLGEYMELLGGFAIGDFFPSMEFIHTLTGVKSRLQDTFRRFDNLFDQMLAERLTPKKEKEDNKDLIDVLLHIQKQESSETPLTMDSVKAVILDMFAAGTDTTFFTILWVMTDLLMNPKALKRAQAEIRAVVGERRVVLESDMLQLDYMKAVIKESYRLHPPAPLLVPRESMEDVTIDGYDIPARTRIFVNAWAIGRDPKTWENPEAFDPERFVGSTIDYKGQDFELLPFGSGRRSCPAIAFGAASFELPLAQLLHSFDWELPPGTAAKDLDLTEVFGITMHRTADLIAVAKPRFP